MAIRVSYGGKVYDGGEHATPTGEGSCGEGDCKDIGTVRLTAETELHPELCTITGIVRNVEGTPLPGATVFAWDETVDPDVWFSLCFSDPLNPCQFTDVTDARGEFTLTTVLLDGLFYYSTYSTQEPGVSLTLWAQGTVQRCQRLDITLTEGLRVITPTVTVSRAGVIDWTPADYEVTSVDVVSSADEVKWLIGSTGDGFVPPITYGVTPAGAEQLFPAGGTRPTPLASGDTVQIVLSGTSSDGSPYFGQGSVVVP